MRGSASVRSSYADASDWQPCSGCATLIESYNVGATDTDGRSDSNAGMAKLADAADLKSADQKWLWGFKSPSRYH